MIHIEEVKRSEVGESCCSHSSVKSVQPYKKKKGILKLEAWGFFSTIMSKPPTIIYKQSVGSEAWNRNQSSYYCVLTKTRMLQSDCDCVAAVGLRLARRPREAFLISIYLGRVTVSIQYLSHSGAHWLHLYSLWWVANWAEPVALYRIRNGWSSVTVYSHHK